MTVDRGGGGGAGGSPFDMEVDQGPDAAVACDPACAGNQICEAGACAENPGGCGDDVDCIGASRICVESACADGCAVPDDCAQDAAGPLCVAGRCGQCRGDDDCPGASTCRDRACVPPDRCTSSLECGGAFVCDDGECTGGFSCNVEDFACPDGYDCGDDGQCRPLAGGQNCESSDQCPVGEVCRASRPRYCGACQTDEDCPGAQTCEAGAQGNRCADAAECAGDDDCVGNRICEAGTCTQPSCNDDDFAGNGTQETAAPLPGDQVYRGLVSCETDWFQVNLPANTVATIVMRQRDREADLTLVAFASNGTELGRSATNRLTEAVVVGPFGSERPVLIEVFQVDALAVAAYDLEISFAERGSFCPDDPFEAGAGDDTEASARYVRGPNDVAFAPVAGRACPGDADWVCFDLQNRERVTISAQVNGGGALLGELFRDGESLAEGRWTSDEREDIANIQGARGTYCLRLSAEGDAVGYSLELQAVSPEVLTLCRSAEPVRLSADGTGTDNGQLEDTDVMSPSCAAARADGGEAVYTVDVAAPSLLVARATGLGRGTLGDPVISLRGSCESANSELACSTGVREPADPGLASPNPAELRAAVEPGTYTLVVDGFAAGDRPDFRLDVEARRLAARPGNDGCDEPRALDFDAAGSARVSVNLDQARDDVAGCLGAGAPDATFLLSLDRPSRVRVDAAAQGDTFAVGAYLVARCGDAVAPVACGFGFDQEVPAGDWILVVDGADANSRGRVEVSVQRDVFAPAPANDTCGGAEPLRAGVTIEADTRGAADDYGLVAGNRCTGFDSRGGDLAYALDLQAGERVFVQAEPIGGWDLSLYVVTDCGQLDPTCVSGHDGALTESVVFTPRAGGRHFVVVDGSNGEAGAFRLRYGPAACGRDADCPNGGRCGPDFTCLP
ncbi:MAG: hypothetical protein H6706_14855 [Myxococcales bacterium]|nr:hypothetical protein [Myxococcales bacterium]